MPTAEAPNPSAEAPTPTAPLEDPDLLFLIFTFLGRYHTGVQARDHTYSVLLTNHTWRAAALRPDLLHWSRCDFSSFMALAPLDLTLRLSPLGTSSQGTSAAWNKQLATHWCCESVEKLLHAKPQLQALDLSHCFVSDAEAVARLVLGLPPTLHTLSLHRGCNQPDAMLRQLLRGLPALPRLRCLDLRGILDERTLAGLRVLDRAQGGAAPSQGFVGMTIRRRSAPSATSLPVSLPALEALSVGFHLHSVLGAREGVQFLTAQAALAPRLRHIGCRVAAEAAWGGMGPVDIVCRCCGGTLYERLDAYVVHPPQQQHISYEIHTDEPPLAAAVQADGADDSRLWCARSCQGQLWLVDHGSGHVRRVLGRKYAIACGPPVGDRPALAMAILAHPAPAEGSEGAAESGPPEPDLEVFPPSLWLPPSTYR
jgi:hypothetical protein